MGIGNWGEDDWIDSVQALEDELKATKKQTLAYWQAKCAELEKYLAYFKKRLGEEKKKNAAAK